MQEVVVKPDFSRAFPASGGHTMKEYDQQISDLKKENFSLKMRIYYLEERVQKRFGDGQDVFKNVELQVEIDDLKRELVDKSEVLQRAALAIETLTANCEQGVANKNGLAAEYQKKISLLEEQLDKANMMLSASHNEPDCVSVIHPTKSIQTDKRTVKFKSLESGADLSPGCQSVEVEANPVVTDRSQHTSASPCQFNQCTQTSPELQVGQVFTQKLVGSCRSANHEITECSKLNVRQEQSDALPAAIDMISISEISSCDSAAGLNHVNVHPVNCPTGEQHFNGHPESFVSFNGYRDVVFMRGLESRTHDSEFSGKCNSSDPRNVSRGIITSPSKEVVSPSTQIVSPSTQIASPSTQLVSPSKTISENSHFTSGYASHLNPHDSTCHYPYLTKPNFKQTSLTTNSCNISHISELKDHNPPTPEPDPQFKNPPSTTNIRGSLNSRNGNLDSLDFNSKEATIPESFNLTSSRPRQIPERAADCDEQEHFDCVATPVLARRAGDGGDCESTPGKTLLPNSGRSTCQGIVGSASDCGGVVAVCFEGGRTDVLAMPGRIVSFTEMETGGGGRNIGQEGLEQGSDGFVMQGPASSPCHQATRRDQPQRDVTAPEKGLHTSVCGEGVKWSLILGQSQAKIKDLEEKLQSTENTVRILSRKNQAFLSAMAVRGVSVSFVDRASSEASVDGLSGSPRKRSSSFGDLDMTSCRPDNKDTNGNSIIAYQHDDSMEKARSHFYSSFSHASQEFWHSSAMDIMGTPSVTALPHQDLTVRLGGIDQSSFNNLDLAKLESDPSQTGSIENKMNISIYTNSSLADMETSLPVSVNNITISTPLQDCAALNNGGKLVVCGDHSSTIQSSRCGFKSLARPVTLLPDETSLIGREMEAAGSPDMTYSSIVHSPMMVARREMEAAGSPDVTYSSIVHSPMMVARREVEAAGSPDVTYSSIVHSLMMVARREVEAAGSPDVTYSSIVHSPMMNQLVARLERNFSSLRDCTFDGSNLSIDQLQVRLEHLQTLNLTLKEEVAVHEALLNPAVHEALLNPEEPAVPNEEPSLGGTTPGGGPPEEDILRHHLIEIKKLRRRLERILESQDLDYASTCQSGMIQKGEQRQKELVEPPHNLPQEILIVTKLELTISELQATVLSQAETIAQLEHEIANLKSNLDSRIERDGKIVEEMNILTNEKAEIVTCWTKREKEFSEMEKHFRFEFSQLKSGSEKLNEEVDEKTKENERLIIEVDGKMRENERLIIEVNEKTRENERLIIVVDEKTRENERLIKEVDEKTSETERLIQEVDSQEERYGHLKEVLIKRERLIQEKVGWLQKLVNEKSVVDQRLKEKEEEMKTMEAEVWKVRRMMEEMRARIGGEGKVGLTTGAEEKVGLTTGANRKVLFETHGDKVDSIIVDGKEVGFRCGDEGSDGFRCGDEGSDGFRCGDEGSDGFRCGDEGSDGFRCGDEGSDVFRSKLEAEVGLERGESRQNSELEETVEFSDEIGLLKGELMLWLEEALRLKTEVQALRTELAARESLQAKIQMQRMGFEAEMERVSQERQALELQLESEKRSKVRLKMRNEGLEVQVLGKVVLEQQVGELKSEIKSLSMLQSKVDQASSKLGCRIVFPPDVAAELTSTKADHEMLVGKLAGVQEGRRIEEEGRRIEEESRRMAEQLLRDEVNKRCLQLHRLTGQYRMLHDAFIKQAVALKEKTDLAEGMKQQLHLFEASLTSSTEEEQQSSMKELFIELLSARRQVEELLCQLKLSSSEMGLPVETRPRPSTRLSSESERVAAVAKEDCHRKLLLEIEECLGIVTGRRLSAEDPKPDRAGETSKLCLMLGARLKHIHSLLSTCCVRELHPTSVQRIQDKPTPAQPNENHLNEERQQPDCHSSRSLDNRRRGPCQARPAWEATLFNQLKKTVQDLAQAKQNIGVSVASLTPPLAPMNQGQASTASVEMHRE